MIDYCQLWASCIRKPLVDMEGFGKEDIVDLSIGFVSVLYAFLYHDCRMQTRPHTFPLDSGPSYVGVIIMKPCKKLQSIFAGEN